MGLDGGRETCGEAIDLDGTRETDGARETGPIDPAKVLAPNTKAGANL